MNSLPLLLSVAVVTCATAVMPAFSQDAWDTDKDVPPPAGTGKAGPVKPVTVKPFTLLFYEVCESNEGTVQYTGRFAFRILSQYRSTAFDCEVGDTLVVVKIRSQNQGVTQDEIYYPAVPFTLLVIICPASTVPDTAVFRLDMMAGTCEYLKRSKLLLTEDPKGLPDGFASMQFFDRDPGKARTFLDEVVEKFGDAVSHTVLPEGFYPCLATETVEKVGIGRGRLLNQTTLGYLVGILIRDATRRAELDAWLWEQQRAEIKRGGQRSDRRK